MEEQYPSNSYRSKTESKSSDRKPIETVAQGKTSSGKSLGRKITETFISGDIKDVRSYIIEDVIVPGIKDFISELITNGTDMLLYGSTRKSRKSKDGRTNYNSIYDGNRKEERKKKDAVNRDIYDYNEIAFDDRAKATLVLDKLEDLLDEYKMVSVADMKEASGFQSDYTDNNWGWMDLSGAKIIRDRGEYILKMPKVIDLK